MFEVDIETLRQSLYSNVPIFFTYFKKDGSSRTALGTLNEDLIPEDKRPKDSSANVGTNLKYFDVEKVSPGTGSVKKIGRISVLSLPSKICVQAALFPSRSFAKVAPAVVVPLITDRISAS